MQIQPFQQPNNNNENQNVPLKLNIQISPIQDYYCINYKAQIRQDFANLFVSQSFVLFILQIRTGMNQMSINVLKRSILDFCEEALQKNINSFGFIINGQYHTIKKANYFAIKEILNACMVVSQQDDYFLTLRKLRHVLSEQIYKYQKNIESIQLIFFTSYVQIDHSLGVKKRSYIDFLNQHEEKCFDQVDKIQNILDKSFKKYNTHIIGLDKKGQEEYDYSQADRCLYNYIHCKLGSQAAFIYFCWANQQEGVSKYNTNVCKLEGLYYVGQDYKPSFVQLMQGFKKLSSLVLSTSLYIEVKIPLVQDTQEQNINKKKEYARHYLYSSDLKEFQPSYPIFIKKSKIKLQTIYNKDIQLLSGSIQQKAIQTKVIKQDQNLNKLFIINSSYGQAQSISQQIYCKILYFGWQLFKICQQLKQQIVSYKRVYLGNNKSQLQMKVNQDKLQDLKNRIFYIQKQSKEIYNIIFDNKKFGTQNQTNSQRKRKSFEQYASLKRKLDVSHQVLMGIFKKIIKNDQIGKISQAVNFWNIRNSLKNKLVRRINLNPKMIDQTFTKIHEIVSSTDYSSIQTQNKLAKHAIGNCIKTNINFGTALRKEDCLAIMIQIQRPDTAIADPGRIRIRQISPFAISVTNFFNVFHYGIDSLGQLDQQRGGQWIRQYAKLQKQNYQQMWDYWALVQKKYTVPALIPVYLCKQHWQIAKLLMKPCLGWTATGQPLGYTFSQFQTIPFMALSFAIRRVQQITYQVQVLEKRFLKNQYKLTQYSLLERQMLNKNLLRKRMKDLCWILQQTCFQIMKDMSQQNFQQKLSELTIQRYNNYIQKPIERTIDVISNNSAFLGHLFCVIKLQMMKKPLQNQFHQFFKRLIEQQLRRQTDGWNQEQTQDQYINKLLNSEVEKMDTPEYVILDSQYYDKFQMLRKGQKVHQTYFQITRNQLQMMVKKDGKFNQTQRMMLIQYKRLYQNRVLWMWYIRFRLYSQIQRVKIHKWKCIDLINSYMLFTMIIQNKKQRKNSKRRDAIMNNQYVDPFNAQKARQYLELQFMRLRAQKERQNIQILNNKKFGNAASTFAYTKSLQQAAGTLINFDIGHHCKIFFLQLERGQTFRVEQKLKMLLLGEYKGIQLFRGWKMSKKRTARLRKVYPIQFQKYGYMF